MQKLSIIVSVFNEEESLPHFYNALKQVISTLTVDTEIIFVNDGSSDQSLTVLNAISKEDFTVKVIPFSRN